MHRQSLGSPSSKLHIHGGAKDEILVAEEAKRRDSVSSSFHVDYDEDNDKAPKSHRLSSPPLRPEKLIHLIPVLTIICFFILYLFSHSPSQSDLAQFNGFKHPSKRIDSAAEINYIQQYTEANRGDILPPEACVICKRYRKIPRDLGRTGNSPIFKAALFGLLPSMPFSFRFQQLPLPSILYSCSCISELNLLVRNFHFIFARKLKGKKIPLPFCTAILELFE